MGENDRELLEQMRAATAKAYETPGVPVELPPLVVAEGRKLMRGEPSAFDQFADPIVGHKAIRNDDGTHRHEPLRESEAKAILDQCEAEKARRAELMPTEKDAARMMFQAWYRLKELGWTETMYGPTNEVVHVIEPGSSGIHEASRHEPWPEKTWWSYDGESWPMTPCLFKRKDAP